MPRLRWSPLVHDPNHHGLVNVVALIDQTEPDEAGIDPDRTLKRKVAGHQPVQWQFVPG